jgi:4-diphosphocytidyl-2-C-methyl-D-erythritol kinase
LLDLASQLGSDVPFFIQGGTALASGRGELLEQIVAPAERHAVIVVPEVAGPKAKTAEMYAYLTPAHYSDGARTVEAARRLHNGTSVGEMAFNVFEAVAWRAGDIIETMRVDFLATHGANPILCGAGPAMFSLFNDKGTADRCAARMRANGYRSFSRRLIQEWPIDGIDVL